MLHLEQLSTPVQFTCIALEASFLISWQENGEEIEPNFNIGDIPKTVTVVNDPYTLLLDEISVGLRQDLVANMTSRLMINLTDLMNGDQVTCSELAAHDSVTLHYEIRGDQCRKKLPLTMVHIHKIRC